MKTVRRKVSWPDAYGEDIAHVQEFESRYGSHLSIISGSVC